MKKDVVQQTGPKTQNGRAQSSQNSTKHGLCGSPSKLLPGETIEQYNAVRQLWSAQYDSEEPGTACLLEALINSDRMMRHASDSVIDAHIALSDAEAEAEPNQERIELLHKNLKNKLRYKAEHERSFQRAFRNIEQFGRRRVLEDNAMRQLHILQHKVTCSTAILCHKHNIDYRLIMSPPLADVLREAEEKKS